MQRYRRCGRFFLRKHVRIVTVQVLLKSPENSIRYDLLFKKHAHAAEEKERSFQIRAKKCGGTARVRVSKTINVDIPAGIDDGQILRVGGQGDNGLNGGPSGDLNVVVSVRPHPLFVRNGSDIHCEIPYYLYSGSSGRRDYRTYY